MADDFGPIYEAAGGGQQLDPLFLQAQTIVESRQNPKAVSPAGALGISQFMPPTARKAGVGGTAIDPLDADQAIHAQAALMNNLIKKYTPEGGAPDVTTALREYHGGPNRAIWGKSNAAYPGLVAAEYTKLKAEQKANPVAKESYPAFDSLMSKSDEPAAPAATPAFDALMAKTDEPAKPVGSVGSKAFPPEPSSRPSDALDMGQGPGTPAPPSTPATVASGFAGEVGNALQRGWNAAPTVLSLPVQTIVDAQNPVAGAAIHGLNGVIGGLNAGYNGLQSVVQQTLDPVGNALTGRPGLGSDVATMMDLAPALRMAGPAGPARFSAGPAALGIEKGPLPASPTAAYPSFGTLQKMLDDPILSKDPKVQDMVKATLDKMSADPAFLKQQAAQIDTATKGAAPNASVGSAENMAFLTKLKEAITSSSPSSIIPAAMAGLYGHFTGGLSGAGIGILIGHIGTKYGPKVASAVEQTLRSSAIQEPIGSAGAFNPVPNNRLQSSGATGIGP